MAEGDCCLILDDAQKAVLASVLEEVAAMQAKDNCSAQLSEELIQSLDDDCAECTEETEEEETELHAESSKPR